MVVFALAMTFYTHAANSAAHCYDLHHLPAVGELSVENGLVHATIIGNGTAAGHLNELSQEAERHQMENRPTIAYDPEAGWRSIGKKDCRRQRGCKRSNVASCEFPAVSLSETEKQLLPPVVRLEQSGGACVHEDDRTYFGLSFYHGEGVGDLGGWGWLDDSGEPTVRRTTSLLHSSVNAIAHDGQHLWLGTYHNMECIGEYPAKGLLVVDLGTERVRAASVRRASCGFVFHDMLMHDGDLWISSDMGVSRVKQPAKDGLWARATHYAPTGDAENPIIEVQCDEIYRNYLKNMEREPMYPGLYSQWYTFLEVLAEHRTTFFVRYYEELLKQLDERGE
ncbi:hypothetical protein [Natronospira bacteriovora]|uniref:Uncharacterized protein n=1 Tax=Natronospira bacteriovora TaxID=3069753 RepID=A0ABU0WA16_9GAMM|nr:hypothetical protein [Natronospira sp. AB-CW4]MDQ2070836.1 hypothetical protein [Natronospira sp. AB-CW4]